MAKRSQSEQLEQALQALGEKPGPQAGPAVLGLDASVAALLRIAGDLRDLPREGFKERLKSELERSLTMASVAEPLAAVRRTATPRLRIKNTAAAIEFYKKAFGANEIMRFALGDEIPYAEIAIGDSIIALGEESPGYGFYSAETLGGSPVAMHLNVEDADAATQRAIDAGARLVSPVRDQFYGERAGQVADPFGYIWGIGTLKEELPVEEMHRRFQKMMDAQAANRTASKAIPEGYHTITPYLVVKDAPGLIDFVKKVFDGEETFRTVGSAGGVHAEVRVGESMLMMGGGAPELSWGGKALPQALHVYVKDTDAVYQRALEAGGTSMQAPRDQDYGERSGSVRDAFGNHWYIATSLGETYVPKGLRTVTPYLHPLRAEPVIQFLKRAFDAKEVAKYASPDGVIHHARVTIGDSVLEMGEAHGPYQPMPAMFYLYVPDVDATYTRALAAGGISAGEPTDQSYGDRTASVKDAFGNQWYLATHIKDV